MNALLTEPFLVSLLFGAVTAGLPLLLAGLGEQISEKAGVLNIGLEGMMLVGAYTGSSRRITQFVLAWIHSGRHGGMCAALIVLYLCIRRGLNQIVIGIAVTVGAEGLTSLLHFVQFSRSYPRLPAAPVWALPLLRQIPVLGKGLFSHNPLVYLSVVLVGVLTWMYRSTYLGLSLEAAGNKPAALDAAASDVVRTRSLAVLCTGFLAGLGGAYMANVGAGLFVPFITGGRRRHRYRSGHARARPASVGIDRRRAFWRQSCHDDGSAGGGHRCTHRRGANAALRRGHAGAGALRPQ